MGYDELKEYAEIHGKKIIKIFILTDLKRKNKEDTVFVMKVKTHIQNASVKRSFSG